MNRFLKVTLGGLCLLVTLVASAIVFAYVFEDKIIDKIKAEINEQVNVPVQVNGGISLSLLKHFPYASLTFSKVEIGDKIRKGNQRLLKVDEFSLLCNIFSLFGNRVEFSEVVVSKGELNIYKDANSNSNLDIFKTSADTSKGLNNLSIRLTKAIIRDVRFTYTDEAQPVFADADVNEIELKGDFNDNLTQLAWKGKLYAHRFSAGGEDYIRDRKMAVDAVLDIDQKNHKYDFKSGKITIEESDFNVSGFFAILPKGTQLDFTLATQGDNIHRLATLLPAKYKEAILNTNGKGEYNISASVKGISGAGSKPAIAISGNLRNGELKIGKYNRKLRAVNASVSYKSDAKGNDELNISNFGCLFEGQPFKFSLALQHLADPTFDFYALGTIDLSGFSGLIPDTILQDLSGTLAFNKFYLRGKREDFTDVVNSTLSGTGNFMLTNVEFRTRGINYDHINGTLTYENRLVEAQNFTLNFLGSDFNFTGGVGNLLAFIYSLDASRRTNGIVLNVNGKLHIGVFNLNNILDHYSQGVQRESAENEGESKITIRDVMNMKGNIDVVIGRFLVRKMDFENIAANLQLAPDEIQINHLATQTMGGELHGQGLLTFTPQNSLRLSCDASMVEISIPSLFSECENFGQTTLTDKHLKGTLTASTNFNAEWPGYRHFNDNALSAVITFSIKNGELVNFEPLKATSKFIRVEELADIRFPDLENTFKISNGRIAIPEFELRNSALNLMISGYHYFNNDVDYHFKINLHKLLANKFKRHVDEDQYIESDPYEGVNLYLSMTGNLANPKIKYDKPAARKKFQADFKQDKENLRNLFRDAPPKKDDKEARREDKYFHVSAAPQFMDFDTTGK